MKFFDKMYVGFSNREKDVTLGFVTPYENTKAFEKRKATIDSWSKGRYASRDSTSLEAKIFDNEPIFGFKIVDTVERYSTSNKLFRIQDPRGFVLEVPVENLLQIIERNTISNGTIAAKMVWAKHNQMYLMNEDSAEYKAYKTPDKDYDLVPGVHLQHRLGNMFYTFLGTFNIAQIEKRNTPKYGSNTGYGWTRHVDSYLHTITLKKHKTRAYVYAYSYTDNSGEMVSTKFEIRKSKIPDLILSETKVPGKAFFTEKFYSTRDLDINCSFYNWNSDLVFFKNKADMDNFVFTKEEIYDKIKKDEKYKYEVIYEGF